MNPYLLLGVRTDAKAHQIKAAYRELAKKSHPDAGGDRAEFENIQWAYDLLMDADRRALFDLNGTTEEPKNVVDDQAKAYLAGLLNQIVDDKRDDAAIDILKVLNDNTNDMLRKVRDNVKQTEKAKARAERLQKRTKRKGEGQNVLGDVFGWRAGQCVQRLAQLAEQSAILERALVLIGEHECEKPTAPPYSPHQFPTQMTRNPYGVGGGLW